MSGTWAAGWLTGDVVTASEFKKGMGAIYDNTLAVAVASFDITAIVATYAHLEIDMQLRGNTAATGVGCLLRFNNDSGANYDSQIHYADGVTTAGSETIAGTSIALGGGTVPAASAPAGEAAQVNIKIANYAGTTFQKTLTATVAGRIGTASGNVYTLGNSGFWRSTTAINRVTILPAAGSWDVGSRITIYAKGA